MAVFANSLANGFALDDVSIIQDNRQLRDCSLLSLLTLPYWDGYRPAAILSYALNWRFAGGQPLAFHAVNVVLHVLATTLLVKLSLRLGAPAMATIVGGAIFAIHPVHSEAVANIVGRAELLVAVFVLLGILAYLRDGWRSYARVPFVLVCYALALGSKETGITMPLLLALVQAFRSYPAGGLRRAFWAARWTYGGLALVTLIYLIVRKHTLGMYTLSTIAYGVPLNDAQRVLNAIGILPQYGRLLFAPWDLVIDYGPAVIVPVTEWQDYRIILGFLTATAWLMLGLIIRRAHPWLSLGVFWSTLAVLPVANLIIPIGIWLAERTLYLASIGVSFIVIAFAWRMRRKARWTRMTAGALTVVALCVGGWRTWERNTTWRSTETALRTLIEEHPESYRAHWWVGHLLAEHGEMDKALAHLQYAIGLAPHYPSLRLEYARVLGVAGKAAQVEALLRAPPALWHLYKYIYLSQALMDQGKNAEALRVSMLGRRHFPAHPEIHRQAARALARLGRTEEAQAAWAAAVSVDSAASRFDTDCQRPQSGR